MQVISSVNSGKNCLNDDKRSNSNFSKWFWFENIWQDIAYDIDFVSFRKII